MTTTNKQNNKNSECIKCQLRNSPDEQGPGFPSMNTHTHTHTHTQRERERERERETEVGSTVLRSLSSYSVWNEYSGYLAGRMAVTTKMAVNLK
jgi:hypothetical protein